MHCTVVRKSGD